MSDSQVTDDRGISRRDFISNPFKRIFTQGDSQQKGGVHRLIDLRELADEEMATIKPRVAANCKISIEGDQVMATINFPLFPVGDDQLPIFNQFNGQQSVAQISQKLAGQFNIDYADAYLIVRDVFISLAMRQVCTPSDPLDLLW